MDDVVPGALQRLRAADIIRMAGLIVASLGQEYCRIGAVHTTKRQGARITGIVDVPHMRVSNAASPTNGAETTEHGDAEQRHYSVEVEIGASGSWTATCSCRSASPSTPPPPTLCPHAAALLYQWLAHPISFVATSSTSPTPSSLKHKENVVAPLAGARSDAPLVGTPPLADPNSPMKHLGFPGRARPVAALRGSMPLDNLAEILAQLGLSELRTIAREHNIATAGLNRQQLAEAVLGVLRQPEAVRRVAGALEKPQRQLLATLTLAGGSITDDDLRGLYERFSLGYANQLQGMLATLQSKGLLFRTSLSGSPLQRFGLSGSLLDVGWYVPAEVRDVLRVTVPITPFDVQKGGDGDTDVPVIQQVQPYRLLTDLLLIARALAGYRFEHDDEKEERSGIMRPLDSLSLSRSPGGLSKDGSVAIPPPSGMPSSSLLESLQAVVPRTPAFLCFAIRLLRLADILHKDDAGTPYLRLLPNAAHLLLGPSRDEVARDLFELWLARSTYEELFDLQEEGLRLRCRATPLNHPVLRPGELEAENAEAQQSLVALLAQVPINQWISFPAFARFIYRLNPWFLQKRQRLFSSPHWWMEQEEGRPLRPTQPNDWLRAEGRYLARLLRGPLHWWGVSDLALASDGRLLAFRLTPLAGVLLGSTMTYEEPLEFEDQDSSPPILEVEVSDRGDPCNRPGVEKCSGFELLVACTSAAWPLIELLEDFVEVVGVRSGRLCYRLSPKLLSEALSRGQRPTALLKMLYSIAESRGPILPFTTPEPKASSDSGVGVVPFNTDRAQAPPSADGDPLARMLAQLERWTASYGRVRLYTGVSLLEVADPVVMRELSATTSVDEQVVQTLSPTLLILKKPGAEGVAEELKRRGQVPLLHEEDDDGAE